MLELKAAAKADAEIAQKFQDAILEAGLGLTIVKKCVKTDLCRDRILCE